LFPLLDVARDNFGWAEYLIGQVLQSSTQQFATLKQFVPRAVKKDWQEVVAGQRVVTIKPHEGNGWFKHEDGELEFGTELVVAEDKSIVALLGASPGASTAASIAIGVLERCFKLTASRWLPKTERNHPVLWRIADQGRRAHPTGARPTRRPCCTWIMSERVKRIDDRRDQRCASFETAATRLPQDEGTS